MERDYTHIRDKLTEETDNQTIIDSIWKTCVVLEQYEPSKIRVSVSGGSDSDLVVDLVSKFDIYKEIKWAFFDTGLEYQATKRHIDFLEEKYQIKIERLKPDMPIPTAVKKYGQPFLTKFTSKMISALIKKEFQFEDLPFEELKSKYEGKRMNSYIKWWTDEYGGRLSVEKHLGLKKFLMENPPDFKISDLCCDEAKKKVAKKANKIHGTELEVLGIRVAEGGVRSIAYKNCYLQRDGVSKFMPIYHYQERDKEEYCRTFGITHSDCYEVYGLERTGCAGCPFGSQNEEELEKIKPYEPQIYKAAKCIFKDSYEYTKRYKAYKEKLKEQRKIERRRKRIKNM